MSASKPAAGRERLSPALWFLAAAVGLLLAAGVVSLLRWRTRAPYAPPTAGDPSGRVAVWRGEAAGSDGSQVHAELATLHADAGRQAFETATLRRRLGLGDGEPWRLRVQRGSAEGALESLSIVQPLVHDAQGLAARALELPPVDGALQDPVLSLLRTPASSLGAAQALDVVLWGRAPEAGAVLRGLELGGVRFELPLAPAQASRAEMERAFTHSARADELAQSGKSPSGAASQGRPRARSGSDD